MYLNSIFTVLSANYSALDCHSIFFNFHFCSIYYLYNYVVYYFPAFVANKELNVIIEGNSYRSIV